VNTPERIWLQVGEYETTWCEEPIEAGDDAAYVRADLLEAANSRIAELESQLKVARDFMLND